jgi:hypothetical protein
MDELPCFRYFVVLSTETYRQTLFQLFDGAWLHAMDRNVVGQIVQCPATLADLRRNLKQRVELRSKGLVRYWIAVAPPGAVELMHRPPPFMVLFTSAETDNWGRQYCDQHAEPVLHVPEKAGVGENGPEQLSTEIFDRFADLVLDRLALYDADSVAAIRNDAKSPDADVKFPSLRISPHIRTDSNTIALLSAGYPNFEVANRTTVNDSSDKDERRAFEEVVSFRERLLDRRAYGVGLTYLLISVAGMSHRLRNEVKERAGSPPGHSTVYRWIRRFDSLDLIPPEIVASYREQEFATALLREREGEIRGQVTAVLVESCSQVLPTALLKRTRGRRLRDRDSLADVLRHRGSSWSKADLEGVRRVGINLASSLPPYVMDYLRSRHGTIKVFADDPYELTLVDGRPLSMSRPVIRIPVTPGVLLSRQVSLAAPLMIERRDLNEILILRGTHPRDPVYPWLELFTTNMTAHLKNVSITTVDVQSAADIERALDKFDGAMMAIDAHGIHLAGEMGYLEIGKSPMTMHGLRSRLPPIIFLAACETHSIGRAEETVAAALLNAGARCVIGTLTSVSALSAGNLFSDLVGRATHWQPGSHEPIRWSEMCAFSMWICHAIEAAFVLAEAKVIALTPEQIGYYADRVEQALLRFHTDWFAVACRELADISGVDVESIREEWLNRAYVTDSVMFCQLGQSDSLFVKPLSTQDIEALS